MIEGSNHDLSCDYPGTLPATGVAYAWSNSAGVISGATAATYSLSAVTFDDSGVFACVVSVDSLASNSSQDYQVSGEYCRQRPVSGECLETTASVASVANLHKVCVG